MSAYVEETISVEDIAVDEAEPFSNSDIIPPLSEDQTGHDPDIDLVSSTTDNYNELETLDGFVAVGGGPESEDVSNAGTGGVEQIKEEVNSMTVESLQQPPAAITSAGINGYADVSDNEERHVIIQKKELTSCPAKWMVNHNIDVRVINLIYWKNWQTTGAVFGGLMFLLLSLICYTFISVVTSFSMALLTVAFLYRIGTAVINAVQKTTSEHPYKHLIDEDLELSEDTVRQWAEEFRIALNSKVKKARRLFLIEDVVESIKFGVLLWLLSYIGSWFSLTTMTIIGCVLLFSLPKLYEDHQEQVDACAVSAKDKLKEIFSKVQEKLPERLQFGKEKKE